MGSERSTSQRHMEAISDILQLFLPGCSQVRRILQARVPLKTNTNTNNITRLGYFGVTGISGLLEHGKYLWLC